MILLLYAILVPWLCETNYSRALRDTTYLQYIKLPPKVQGLEWLGMGGTKTGKYNETDYIKMNAIAQETGHTPIAEVINDAHIDPKSNSNVNYYDLKIDVYQNMGMMYLTLTPAQYEDIQAWQDEHQIQVIFPAITDAKQTNANIWYEVTKKGAPKLKDGELNPIYRTTTATDTSYHSLRIAADNDPEKPLAYARVTGTSESKSYVVRVDKYNYFQYRYGFEPAFVFGTNATGQDIFTRLAAGARFSFMLAISISLINLVIGTFYGAVQGLLRRLG